MIRNVLLVLMLVPLVLVVAPAGLLAAWIIRRPGPLFALAFPSLRILLRVAGVRTRVRGREHIRDDRSYVFSVNHQSNLDPPIVVLAIDRPIRVLGKAVLFRLPILGSVFRGAGFIPVDRQDRDRARRAVDEAAEALRAGDDFLIFPEGTRSRDGELLPFKRGPFVMAIEAQVPILPAVVDGTGALWPKGAWRVRSGEVTLTFLEPIPTAGLTYADRGDLGNRVRAAMEEALRRGRAESGQSARRSVGRRAADTT